MEKQNDKENVEIVKCKVFGVCRPDVCPAWIVLTDWQGCAFQLSEMVVKESVREGARSLDQIMAGIIKLLDPRE